MIHFPFNAVAFNGKCIIPQLELSLERLAHFWQVEHLPSVVLHMRQRFCRYSLHAQCASKGDMFATFAQVLMKVHRKNIFLPTSRKMCGCFLDRTSVTSRKKIEFGAVPTCVDLLESSRTTLRNDHFLAKVSFDTAENEAFKLVWSYIITATHHQISEDNYQIWGFLLAGQQKPTGSCAGAHGRKDL